MWVQLIKIFMNSATLCLLCLAVLRVSQEEGGRRVTHISNACIHCSPRSKRMDSVPKLTLIQSMGIVPRCATWASGFPLPPRRGAQQGGGGGGGGGGEEDEEEDDEDDHQMLVVRLARLLATLATEVRAYDSDREGLGTPLEDYASWKALVFCGWHL